MFEDYCASLEAGAAEKWRLIAPWIPHGNSGEIVDIGSGTGKLAAMLSKAHPGRRLIAIDHDARMVSAARRLYGPGVSFRRGGAARVHSAKAAAVVFSSVLHEVYSNCGDSAEPVFDALRCANESLATDGRVIIRDFVRPRDAMRAVILRHRHEDVVSGHDF